MLHGDGVLYRAAWEARVCPVLHPNGSDDDDGVGGEAAARDGSDTDPRSHDNDPCNLIVQILYTG